VVSAYLGNSNLGKHSDILRVPYPPGSPLAEPRSRWRERLAVQWSQ